MRKGGFFRGVIDNLRSTVSQPSSAVTGAKVLHDAESEEQLKSEHFRVETVSFKQAFFFLTLFLFFPSQNSSMQTNKSDGFGFCCCCCCSLDYVSVLMRRIYFHLQFTCFRLLGKIQNKHTDFSRGGVNVGVLRIANFFQLLCFSLSLSLSLFQSFLK